MLEDFVEDLLVEKGLTNLDPDVRFALIAEMSDKATQLINRRVIDSMSESQIEAFNQLIDTNPDQEMIQNFINHNVKDKQQITAKALLEFRTLYLGEAA